MAASGQMVGYRRFSTEEQYTARQLGGFTLDDAFEDRASGVAKVPIWALHKCVILNALFW